MSLDPVIERGVAQLKAALVDWSPTDLLPGYGIAYAAAKRREYVWLEKVARALARERGTTVVFADELDSGLLIKLRRAQPNGILFIRNFAATRPEYLEALRAELDAGNWSVVVIGADWIADNDEEKRRRFNERAEDLGVVLVDHEDFVYALEKQREGAPTPEPLVGMGSLPAPTAEAAMGACRRCAVCLQWDVAQGCCTACGGRLQPLPNPPVGHNTPDYEKLKRRLMR